MRYRQVLTWSFKTQQVNYVIRKAGTISQNIGSLDGNIVSADVSIVDNSIVCIWRQLQKRNILLNFTEKESIGLFHDKCRTLLSVYQLSTTYNCAVSTMLIFLRTNTLFIHRFLARFPSLRREVRRVRYHAAFVPFCVCGSYFGICTGWRTFNK
jgi:hypothetical protein